MAMKARRSESCPRPSRKNAAQLTAALSLPPSAPPVARACTLQELGPEDKQKVAKLLKQVVDLGQEVQQLRQQRDEQANESAQREEELRESNRQLHKEHQLLKKKLGQVLLVLRASQSKVHSLEAAQQAAQEAQCATEEQARAGSDAGERQRDQLQQGSNEEETQQWRGREPSGPQGVADNGPLPSGRGARAATAHGTMASAAPSGAPPLLHVAPGAHVNITIHHSHEPHNSLAPTAPAAAAAASPAKHTAMPHHAAEGATSSPAATDIISVPTTTTAMAMAGTASGCASTAGAGGCSATADGPLCGITSSPTAPRGRQPGGGGGGGDQVAGTATGSGAGWLRASYCGSVASSSAQGAAAGGRSHGPRSILVDATMQHFEDMPIDEVRMDSHEAPAASPMIMPPSVEVVAAASSLLGWQTQHGFMAADDEGAGVSSSPRGCSGAQYPEAQGPQAWGAQRRAGAAATGRKVLSYDPAIGKNGAFYFVDVADVDGDTAAAAGRGLGQRPPGVPTGAAAKAAAALERSAALHDDEGFGSAAGPSRASVAGVAARGALDLGSLREGVAGPPRPPHRVHDQQQHWPGHALLHEPRQLHQQFEQQQGLQQQGLQQQVQPPSPYSSAPTDSTVALTPTAPLHAAAAAFARGGGGGFHGHGSGGSGGWGGGGGDATPTSSGISLAGMAAILDEVARRQRWDAQPPPIATAVPPQPLPLPPQPLARAGTGELAPAHPPSSVKPMGTDGAWAWVQSSDGCSARYNTSHRGPYSHSTSPGPPFRHGASAAAAAAGMAGGVGGGESGSGSACGSSAAGWQGAGGSCVTERYDESLVDILSQADEDMEQQQQQQQRHHQHQQLQWQQQQQSHARQRQRLQPVRPQTATSSGGGGGSGAGGGVGSGRGGDGRHHTAASAAAACTLLGLDPGIHRARQQVASMEALLAANLYEENDVLSVILAQEQ